MDQFTLIGLMVGSVVLLTPVADRLRIPQPVLLTIFGLAIALVPGSPQLLFDPELILPVVLPPLLFAATQRATVREFRDHAGAVFFLAVGLTLATIGVVGVLAHQLGLSWWVALMLGAMVSPPDPVAATAVARRLRLPARMVTILPFKHPDRRDPHDLASAAPSLPSISARPQPRPLLPGVNSRPLTKARLAARSVY